MSIKRKFYQISKEDENSNDSSSMQQLPTPNKGTKRMKNENGKITQKLFMNPAEERTLLSLRLKFKGDINISLAKKDSQSDEEIMNSKIKIEEEKCTKQV